MHVQWLGDSGFLLSDGSVAVAIDPPHALSGDAFAAVRAVILTAGDPIVDEAVAVRARMGAVVVYACGKAYEAARATLGAARECVAGSEFEPLSGWRVAVVEAWPRPSARVHPAQVALAIDGPGARVLLLPEALPGPQFKRLVSGGTFDLALFPGWWPGCAVSRGQALADVRTLVDIVAPQRVFAHGGNVKSDFFLDIKAEFARSGAESRVLDGAPGVVFRLDREGRAPGKGAL